MQGQLPDGIEMKMEYNQADFIQAAIDQGFSTLIEAIVLVSLVVVLFLGSFRVASVPHHYHSGLRHRRLYRNGMAQL